MAIPDNGYQDEAAAYEFARLRFPTNFVSVTPSAVFNGALRVAGDIVNSNDSSFIGQKRPGLTGGRTWPRQTDGGADEEPYLTSTLPDPLVRGYEWLAIGVAVSPAEFGIATTTDGSIVNTTGGGSTEYAWGNLRVKKSNPSDRRITRSGTILEEVPFELQFHFQQALTFFKLLLREGAQFRIPGLTEQNELRPQEEPSPMSSFMVV